MSWNGGFSRLEGIGRFAQDRHDGSPWRAIRIFGPGQCKNSLGYLGLPAGLSRAQHLQAAGNGAGYKVREGKAVKAGEQA